jgi:hypothetical protein
LDAASVTIHKDEITFLAEKHELSETAIVGVCEAIAKPPAETNGCFSAGSIASPTGMASPPWRCDVQENMSDPQLELLIEAIRQYVRARYRIEPIGGMSNICSKPC